MPPTAIGSTPRQVQLADAPAAAQPAPAAPAPSFARVKAILDRAVHKWQVDQDREPHLEVHGPNFRWSTHQELMDATVELGDLRFRLIDPALIGNGGAEKTWLIQYLRRDGDMFVRMPSGGPYIPDDQIDEIAAWINAGCPEGEPAALGEGRLPDLGRSRELARRFARPANGATLQLAAPRV